MGIEQIYENLNQTMEFMMGCVDSTARTLMQDVDDLNQDMQIQLHEYDFSMQLKALYLGSQQRLAMTMEQIMQSSPHPTWLADFVDEGLYTCLDIRSLTSNHLGFITDTAVVQSLMLANELFTVCRLLSILGKELRRLEGTSTPHTRRHMEQ